jgi:DNA-binding transcriptional LysR family regulator
MAFKCFGRCSYFDGFDIYQQSLQASHRFVGIARAGHPLMAGEGPTLERFQGAEHAVIGHDHPPIYDAFLREQGVQRNIRVVLSVMAGAHSLIENSDLIAIVPEMLARMYQAQSTVQAFELPLALPPLEVKMFWHRRCAHDPAIRWLRHMVAQDFGATHLPEPSA